MLKKGFVHAYTGNGKGKTTAALGLALRASGAGMKTYCLMLMKDFPYSEFNSLSLLAGHVTVVKTGKDDFVFRKEKPPKEEIDKTASALDDAFAAMISGAYDLVILDEIFVAVYFGLTGESQILKFIRNKPENTELIFTGRYATEAVLAECSLVTEMREIKHYYTTGVLSRKGIDC